MLLELRRGVQAAAGVVEVDVAARVEPAVLRRAQLVKRRGGGERGVRGAKRRLGAGQAGRREGVRSGGLPLHVHRHRAILMTAHAPAPDVY